MAEPVREASSIERGRAMFVREWQVVDEQTPNGDGLGPMFNARSCIECHNQGGVGGSGSLEQNVDLLSIRPLEHKDRVDREKFAQAAMQIHPGFVPNPGFAFNAFNVLPSLTLHKFGVNSAYSKWRSDLLTLVNRRAPGDDAAVLLTAKITKRNTPSLFGVGVVESISTKVLQKVARRQAKFGMGIKGRLAVANDGGVGKFGWRGQTASLKNFVMGACANELGLQVPSSDQALDPLAPSLKLPGLGFAIQKVPGLDLDQEQCDALAAFVASLPPPAEREPTTPKERLLWTSGARIFRSVGCADCHMQKLGNVDGIYSDLLLHDMGRDLADPVTATVAASSGVYYGGASDIFAEIPPESKLLWRTPPLWGVGNSAPYLHDGRALTLDEAIFEHGGEATNAKDGYLALSRENRRRLLAFLESVGHRSDQ